MPRLPPKSPLQFEFASNAISTVIKMQIGVSCFQVFVAATVGIWLALTQRAQVKAAALGAQFSFFCRGGRYVLLRKGFVTGDYAFG